MAFFAAGADPSVIGGLTCRDDVGATCWTTVFGVLGSMGALTNGGGTIQIWNQKPTPLVAAVFQIGEPQKGKSRLHGVCEEIFDTLDDVVSDQVEHMPARAGGPVTVKSVNLQSFTFPDFFLPVLQPIPDH